MHVRVIGRWCPLWLTWIAIFHLCPPWAQPLSAQRENDQDQAPVHAQQSAANPPASSVSEDEQPARSRRGVLVSIYAKGQAEPAVQTIWPKPAFTLTDGSLSPLVPGGPFRIRFQASLWWNETSPVQLAAFVRGRLQLRLAGEVVMDLVDHQGSQLRVSDRPVVLDPGFVPVEIDFQSLDDLPARLQIWWQSEQFSSEPIPAWLFYLPEQVPEAFALGPLYEQGRHWAERLGCGRCHPGTWPGIDATYLPGPMLQPSRQPWNRHWLLRWLKAPAQLRSNSGMPALFSTDRRGFVERWILAEYLAGNRSSDVPTAVVGGDHRMGRRLFISVGCIACHFMPDQPPDQQVNTGQSRLELLADRWSEPTLAEFLRNPLGRYPDGRMPSLRLSEKESLDIAAFLLLWSQPSAVEPATQPGEQELIEVMALYRAENLSDAAEKIIQAKRCNACHPGAWPKEVNGVPLPQQWSWHQGCLEGQHGPRFAFPQEARQPLQQFLWQGQRELGPSAFLQRQRQLQRRGCLRCHQRDTDESPPLEQVAATLGGAWLQRVPYQRTPRLTFALQRLEPTYLVGAIRDGVSGVRHPDYTYRMPAFGDAAPLLLQALSEGDGDWPTGRPPSHADSGNDPTAATLYGPELVGSQGYSCISCHVWKGRMFAEPDPGAVGPDLVQTAGRVRREWFDRILENPLRLCPRTPMPAVFPRGAKALVGAVLDGDAARQKDAIWAYLALGKQAPDPQGPMPWLVEPPPRKGPVRVAQIPLHLDERRVLESLTLCDADGRVLVVDLQRGGLVGIHVDAAIYRHVVGRRRTFVLSADSAKSRSVGFEQPLWLLELPGQQPQPPSQVYFQSYDRLQDGMRVTMDIAWPTCRVGVVLELAVEATGDTSVLRQRWKITGIPQHAKLHAITLHGSATSKPDTRVEPHKQSVEQTHLTIENHHGQAVDDAASKRLIFTPSPTGQVECLVRAPLEPSLRPTTAMRPQVFDPGRPSGPLERPGYRAVSIDVPKTPWGEDAVMPSAIAVTPTSGRVLVASMKLGELWEIVNPLASSDAIKWRDYANGLFQEAYSMTASEEAVYLLHRRNLTAIRDMDGDGFADRFERVAALPHGVADTYDYGYGLVRERSGSFVLAFAPYANRHIVGSGGAVRYDPMSGKFIEIAFGMRNPVGWCADTAGNIFFTDNQGEWVATNKLCHVVEGRYYGFPNPDQPHHQSKPFGRTAVWVPYAWAHSVNGVACDTTQGRFGPFAGQLFMAELMFGGAIIRADVEMVNGQAQGACFPFWGRGLLGPLTLAFHPSGALFVGSITEPGWMAQPDRGGLYRIDFTGETPFEIQTIRVVPDGFRLVFTRPVDRGSARQTSSYFVEHFRYEYTGAYGSPELDRTQVAIQQVEVSPDSRQVILHLGTLTPDRVYMINAAGVRSANGETLVHTTGAYTLQEVPSSF